MVEINPELQGNFLDRVEREVRRRERKAETLRQEHADKQCTFHPVAAPAAKARSQQIMIESARLSQHLGESVREKMERLSYRDAERIASVRASLTESHYAQFDFQPRISAKSRSPQRISRRSR